MGTVFQRSVMIALDLREEGRRAWSLAVHQSADVDQMQLPTLVFVRRIDAHHFCITRQARVRIDTPFTGVNRRQMKMAEIDAAARGDLVEVRGLHPLFAFRIRVAEDPLVAGQIAAVSPAIEHATANLANVAASINIFKEKIPPAIVAIKTARLRQKVILVSPDKMGSVAITANDTHILTLGSRRDDSRPPRSIGITPAVQEDEPRTIGVVEKVIEVMLDAGLVVRNESGTSDLSNRKNGFHVAGG